MTLTTPVHTLSLHFGARVPGRAEDSVGQRGTVVTAATEHHSHEERPGREPGNGGSWPQVPWQTSPGRICCEHPTGLGAGESGGGDSRGPASPSTRFGGVTDVTPDKHTPSHSGEYICCWELQVHWDCVTSFAGWGSGREQVSNKAKSVPSQLFPVSPPLQSQTLTKSRKHYRKSPSVY